MRKSNYEKLTRLIVKEIRGKNTQQKMSSRFGLHLNQWHKWESGQKTFMWSDLKKISAGLDIDLETPMRMTSQYDVTLQTSIGVYVKKIIQKYGIHQSEQALRRLNVSKATLHRFLNTKKDIPVAFIFMCLGELSSTLPFFTSFLVKDFKNSALRDSIYKMNRQVQLEADFPWLSAIEAFLQTKQYQTLKSHSDRFIATQLGLSVNDIKDGLMLLLENQVVLKEAKKYKLNIHRIDLDTNTSDSARFARFWTDICLRRHQTPDFVPLSRKGWASRVFPVSKEAAAEIVSLKDNFVYEISKILQLDEDREKDFVQVFVMHHFNHLEFKNLQISGKNS